MVSKKHALKPDEISRVIEMALGRLNLFGRQSRRRMDQ